MTLEGYLEHIFYREWRPEIFDGVKGPLRSAREVLAMEHLNPRGKKLDAVQLQQLEDLVEKLLSERRQSYERVWRLRQDARLRSIRAGRYVVAAPTSVAGSSDARAQLQAAGVSALDQARAKVGLPDGDWRYSQTASDCHDGVQRNIVLWFTRYEEPEFFRAEAENRATTKRHGEQFAAFFAALP